VVEQGAGEQGEHLSRFSWNISAIFLPASELNNRGVCLQQRPEPG